MKNTHTPKKRFGQNFLTDQYAIARIIDAIDVARNDTVVEIGPGLGALTTPLLKALDRLTVIEIDRDLIAHWQAQNIAHLHIIAQNALEINFATFGTKVRVVGNLPYNISTPILFHLIDNLAYIDDMHFMLQKEVVMRMSASPNSKEYGRLSVMVQYHCQVRHLFDVPAGAFYPPPKVVSAIVRLVPKKNPKRAKCAHTFANVVRTAFNYRRKQLGAIFKGVLNKDDFSCANILPTLRPENLAVEDFICLSDVMYDKQATSTGVV